MQHLWNVPNDLSGQERYRTLDRIHLLSSYIWRLDDLYRAATGNWSAVANYFREMGYAYTQAWYDENVQLMGPNPDYAKVLIRFLDFRIERAF